MLQTLWEDAQNYCSVSVGPPCNLGLRSGITHMLLVKLQFLLKITVFNQKTNFCLSFQGDNMKTMVLLKTAFSS